MRRFLPLLMLLPALAVASGCGSDDLPSVSVADAAQETRDAQTARTTIRMEMTGAGLPQPVTITAEGVTATDAPRMDLTFELAQAAGARARVLLDGPRLHAQVPQGLGFDLPGGASWVTVDLARAAELLGIDPAGLGEVFRLSPEQQLVALEAAGSMKKVGEEEIDGVRTTHLRGTITLRDYAATLPAERRAKLRSALERLAELSGEEPQDLDAPAPTELWVDEDARIRRMTQKTELPARQGLPAGSMTMRIEFEDFGTALDVEPPPSGETFDATRPLVRVLR